MICDSYLLSIMVSVDGVVVVVWPGKIRLPTTPPIANPVPKDKASSSCLFSMGVGFLIEAH